ncbi:MAG: hypothetical protein Dbin4_02360, partial [Alphaproteobacteria bacterium]|nr:hypothetical protein [Alphaproteobacteria bacterium]
MQQFGIIGSSKNDEVGGWKAAISALDGNGGNADILFRNGCRTARGPVLVSSHQPITNVTGVKVEKSAIPPSPCTIVEIELQLFQPCGDISKCVERRHGSSNPRIEIGARSAPVGIEETIDAVVGHGNGLHFH